MTVIKQKECDTINVSAIIGSNNTIKISDYSESIWIEKESIPALIEELKKHLPK